MKEPIYFLNGAFIKKSLAKISVLDLGFLRSYGVVEFLITYNKKPFLLDEHIKRFYASANTIGLEIYYKFSDVKKIIYHCLKKNNFNESAVWLIASGGVGPTTTIPAKKNTFVVLVDKYKPYPKKCYKNGIKIITYNSYRLFPSAKTMVYTQAIHALKKAYQKKAIEALYLYQGKATECTTSNFFIIKKNKLLTAKDSDVLKGITRELVLKICRRYFKILRKDIYWKDVLNADEAFITATNKEVMPVIKIDNYFIGNGRVGEQTKKIMALFADYIQKNYFQK